MFSITLKIVLIATLGASITQAEMLTGGLTEEKHPSAENNSAQTLVQTLSDDIKSQVSQKLSTSSGNGATSQESFKNDPIAVLSYKTQVVAGTNYFVKAKINKYIFLLRIFEGIHQAASLERVKGPISETDEISYF